MTPSITAGGRRASARGSALRSSAGSARERRRRDTESGVSPTAKGVQFDNVTVENREDTGIGGRDRAASQSTDPLVTDSFSGDSDELINANPRDDFGGKRLSSLVKNRGLEIQEQWGYDPRRLNRIKMRREHELEEFNFGIDFA